jgi:hypothetical protein
MDDSLYSELATVLALNTFARCIEDADGFAIYEHFNANRLGIPPDILSRLGVMRPEGPDKWLCSPRHVFANHWRPGQPLDFKRHDGEPSIFDLIVAVCLLVEWGGDRVREGIRELEVPPISEFPALNLKDHRRFNSEPQLTFCDLVFCKAARHLVHLGLGAWKENGRFELVFSLLGSSPIDLADTYRETRHLTSLRLGGAEFLFPPD